MMRHRRSYWIGVAIVIALGLLAIETAGQSTSAQGMFEGRPALAGAQDGLGAQAGPAQGGIGLQGSQGAQLDVRPPPAVGEQVQEAPGGSAEEESVATEPQDRVLPKTIDRRLSAPEARREAQGR